MLGQATVSYKHSQVTFYSQALIFDNSGTKVAILVVLSQCPFQTTKTFLRYQVVPLPANNLFHTSIPLLPLVVPKV